MLATPLLLAAGAGLRPLKPDVVPRIPLAWALLAIALLVAGGILASRARLRARQATPEPPPARPAGLKARLEAVRKAGWVVGDDQLKACEVVADVMRDLARGRFDVAAHPMTTAELLSELRAKGAPTALCAPLGDVLSACDLVKFAGARLDRAELLGHLETAVILVDTYGSAPAPAAQEPAERTARGRSWQA